MPAWLPPLAIAWLAACAASSAMVLIDMWLGHRQTAVSHSLFDAKPDSAVYWFMMQIAMMAGFATSLPANWWLIRRKWKDEM